MKKHRYKATNVKNVNWDKIAAQVVGQPMVLGIDVAKDDFFAVLMKADRSVLETIKWGLFGIFRGAISQLKQRVI